MEILFEIFLANFFRNVQKKPAQLLLLWQDRFFAQNIIKIYSFPAEAGRCHFLKKAPGGLTRPSCVEFKSGLTIITLMARTYTLDPLSGLHIGQYFFHT